MPTYEHEDAEFYKKLQVAPPDVNPHGTDEDIRSQMKPLKTWGWKLEGNQLTAQTDHGPLTQTIPSNYICRGTDEKGLPLLEKIVL
jgi:hypothetical protein